MVPKVVRYPCLYGGRKKIRKADPEGFIMPSQGSVSKRCRKNPDIIAEVRDSAANDRGFTTRDCDLGC